MISCCSSSKTGKSLIKLSCTNQPNIFCLLINLWQVYHEATKWANVKPGEHRSYKRQCELHVWWVSRLDFQRRERRSSLKYEAEVICETNNMLLSLSYGQPRKFIITQVWSYTDINLTVSVWEKHSIIIINVALRSSITHQFLVKN